MQDVGVVVIGRNEGDRLRVCLSSVAGHGVKTVYVDSGSTDGSVALARSLGAEVVELDLTVPFTAARARNTGVDRLLEIEPDVALVQFVDGDCEVVAGWLATARDALDGHPDRAAVCGRLRERHPDRSVYNRLCDLEWDVPAGEVAACGGIAMMRAAAFREAGGFDATLIAGEEPELCVRLRDKGWRIVRLDAEMALHDAEMVRFSQWWTRSVRAGHAYAERRWLHRLSPQRPAQRDTRSIWAYGVVVPLAALLPAWPTAGWSLGLLAIYPLLWWRVCRHQRKRGFSAGDARLYAAALVLAKFPQVAGQMRFHAHRLCGTRQRLLEYK